MPEVVGHPNRAEFRGVLTMVDVPSQRPPSGAKGHLVMLTKKAAEAALPSLLGMALDYSPTLDRHDVRRKVGVITRAEIAGRNLELGGYLFARDFPEIVEEIGKAGRGSDHESRSRLRATSAQGKTLHAVECSRRFGRSGLRTSLQTAARQIISLTAALQHISENGHEKGCFRPTINAEIGVSPGAGGLGLSYEVANVRLTDTRARIWTLEQVTFTGAAILRKDKAAYRDTWIELE